MKESAVSGFMFFFFLGRDDFLTYADWGPKSKKTKNDISTSAHLFP